MSDDSTFMWDNVEEKLDQAITEVMLTDRWRDAPTLIILQSVIQMSAPLPVKVEAKKLLDLLETPVRDMTDVQTIALSSELVGLLRFVCHRGHEDV